MAKLLTSQFHNETKHIHLTSTLKQYKYEEDEPTQRLGLERV
jgi:hypothetical protein